MSRHIYLDNAATTFPKPEVVYQRMDKFLREECVNAGRGSYELASRATRVINETRGLLLELVNATPESKVIFSPSATIAINQVLRGLDYSEIRNVYVSPFEHNAIMRTLHSLQKMYEFEINIIPFDNITFALKEDDLRVMFSKNNPDLTIMSHVSNVTGFILPIEEFHQLAKQYNPINIVDTAQSLGVVQVDAKNEFKECDFIIFAGHKSLYGPFGIGGFIKLNDKVPLNEVITGGTGSDSTNLEMPSDSESYYEAGSYNMYAIAGLNEALKWLKQTGISNIFSHKKQLTEELITTLQSIDGIEIYIPENLDKHIGVVSFNLTDYAAEDVGRILSDEYKISVRIGHHCSPLIGNFLEGYAVNGTVRISLSYFNKNNDIVCLLDAIESINGGKNNASGENINSLAESQVTNKYYNSIRIDRKLGKYIVNKINNGELKSYIITGHAGDGKTSILVQILKELDLLNNGESLKMQETKQNDKVKLMYVKDMSELSESNQIDLLKASLEAPKEGKSSILISNTGPLIKSFIKLFGENDQVKESIEDKLLKQLDSNECSELEIANNKFYLINMARIENIGFVKEIINKICADNLWKECEECSNKNICPAYFNKLCVQYNSDRVIRFIEMYYRWLQENDKRITIRQMLSQISFAFTGNIDCSEISTYYKSKYIKFNLNFANLFFGYRGIEKIKDSDQIKGIRLINEINLDDSAFEEDYEIFVKENFSYFSKDIEDEVKNVWKEYNKQIFECEREDRISLESKQHMIRKAIRRFFLMYGLSDDITKEGKLYNQVYGKNFYEYVRATTSKLSRRELKQFSNIIYQALYIKNVGVPPGNNTDLYLTLTRNDSSFHSVLLMLAKANEKDLEVKQFNRNIDIEDVEKSYVLKLIIKEKEEFKLSLPILIYFYSLVDGEINTEINPSLSHGLAELNAKLIRNFRNNEDDSILSLIVNTINGVREVEIEITEDSIYFGI